VPLPSVATPIVDDEEDDLAEFARMLDAALEMEANGSVEEGPAADEAIYFRFAALALTLEATTDEDGDENQDQESHDVEAMDES
jgi:hypothetical protein